MLRALLFDLDDTLFPQATWLNGAWGAVAATAAQWGAEEQLLRATLLAVAALGSDQGKIIDRALALVGLQDDVPVAPLVDAFRAHAPTRLRPYPGVLDALEAAKALVPVALVTDGDPLIQRRKLDALGLTHAFAAVVIADERGREFRKPHPYVFVAALDALGVDAPDAVMIGDRPSKDVVGATAVGMRAIRVRQGEYAAVSDAAMTWAITVSTPEAVEFALARREDPWRPAGAFRPAGAPDR